MPLSSIQVTATFADVMLNIAADDLFHAMFNEVCAEYADQPVTRMGPYMGKLKEGQ